MSTKMIIFPLIIADHLWKNRGKNALRHISATATVTAHLTRRIGHPLSKDVSMTMIYTYMLNRAGKA